MAINTNASASTNKLQQYEQIFTTSGTWVKPAGVTEVEVTCIGGGAAGYSGIPGSAGGYIKRLTDVTGISSASIIVGAGSTTTFSGTQPGDGGTSSFGNIVYAYGGKAYNTRWSQYASWSGSFDSGVAEHLQNPAEGVSGFKMIEVAYNNQNGSSTTPLPGGTQVWGNNKTAYSGNLFVSATGTTSVLTSSDGITWTQQTGVLTNSAGQVAYGQGLFVAVSTAAASTVAMYSSNGITWQNSTLPTSQTWTGVCFGNGVFVAYSIGSSAAAYSTNGTTWTSVTLPYSVPASTTLTFLNGYFLGYYMYSTNGSTWNTNNVGINPSTFTYGNGIWVASNVTATSSSGSYTYTSNPTGSWTSGGSLPVTWPGLTLSYASNPIFIYDRFFITATTSTTDYRHHTYIFSSTDAINWNYVRTKPNPNYSGTAGGMYYITDAIAGANNRWLVTIYSHFAEYSVSNYNSSTINIMSPYMTGGFSGQLQFTNQNPTGWYQNSGAYSAPGAFSSGTENVSSVRYTSSSAHLGYFYGGEGSPEGYARGGNYGSYYDIHPDSQQMIYRPPYGSGGRPVYSSSWFKDQPGGNGIVMLKWWQ